MSRCCRAPACGRAAASAATALGVLLLLLPARGASQQEAGEQGAEADRELRVFLDCPGWLCDFEHVRRSIPYVRWVRDRQAAHVHLLVTEQETGGGGQRVTLDFLGRRDFEGVERRLTYGADPTRTDTEIRDDLVQRMELGLVTFLAETSPERLEVSYRGEPDDEAGSGGRDEDPWDRWVFETDVGGTFRSRDVQSSYSVEGSLAANRTTREWKIDLGMSGRYSESRFDLEGGQEFVSVQRRFGLEGLVVNSVGRHWGVGGRASLRHSTRRNQDTRWRLGPAVEYNLFPYSESTRRQFTLLYAVTGERYEYLEPTVFGKLSETRGSHSLTASLDVQEPWGEVGVSLRGSHFLDAFQQNRITLSGRTELQLVQGLSLDVFGSASRIQDQIYLPASEATEEEVLVGEREFQTDFSYFVRIGLGYTFGSIYSGVVNPRFENIRDGT